MKKLICLILALLSLVTLCACGNESNDETTAPVKDIADGFYVKYNGVNITLGAAAEAIIEKLGEPSFKDSIADCGDRGAQVLYRYPSVEIYVLESDKNGNTIDEIVFLDDMIETPEGVYIGMNIDTAKEKMKSASYGEPQVNKNTGALEYTRNGYMLSIGYKNSVINQIYYREA